jgi:hypothetical protein
VRHAILGRSAHATSRAELLHYFRVQEHEKISVAHNSSACSKARIKESKNNQAHRKGQVQEGQAIRIIEWTSCWTCEEQEDQWQDWQQSCQFS